MVKNVVNKLILSIGVLFFLFGSIFAGTHYADDILSGNFTENYDFTGVVDFTSATVSGLDAGGDTTPTGTISAFFLSSCPSGWIPADGTASTPDLRGQFIRGLNDFGSGSRSDGKEDPDGGSRTLGDWQIDTFMSHTHNQNRLTYTAGSGWGADTSSAKDTTVPVSATGDNETRPKNVGLIYCMKSGTSPISSTGGILSSFSVHKNDVNQSISSAVVTKLTWSSKNFDTNNEFNLTSNRFEPKIGGKYLLVAGVKGNDFASSTNFFVGLLQNGEIVANGNNDATISTGVSDILRTVSVVVDANPGDYFEVQVYHDSGTAIDFDGAKKNTYFTGARIEAESYWANDGQNISYSGGNVGIGTTTPTYPLEIVDGLGTNSIYGAGMVVNRSLAYFQTAAGSNGGIRLLVNGTQDKGITIEGTTGKVGIGTSLPLEKLQVGSLTSPENIGLILSNISEHKGSLRWYNSSGIEQNAIRSYSDLDMSFITNQTKRVTITSSGNVGIGTTTPSYKLHVANSGTGDGIRVELGDSNNVLLSTSGGVTSHNLYSSGDAGRIALYSGGAITTLLNPNGATYFTGGNVGIGTSSTNVALDVTGSIEYTGTITDVSDIRLKENFKPIKNPIQKVQSLNGFYFDMKNKSLSNQTELGVSAQDVEKVLPELVFEGPEGYKSVNYVGLIPLLIEVNKKQQEQIEFQQTQIDMLNQRLINLENK